METPRIHSSWHSRALSLGATLPTCRCPGLEGVGLRDKWGPKARQDGCPAPGVKGLSVPKRPVRAVPGRGWMFPLDGDKRLQRLCRVGARGVTRDP